MEKPEFDIESLRLTPEALSTMRSSVPDTTTEDILEEEEEAEVRDMLNQEEAPDDEPEQDAQLEEDDDDQPATVTLTLADADGHESIYEYGTVDGKVICFRDDIDGDMQETHSFLIHLSDAVYYEGSGDTWRAFEEMDIVDIIIGNMLGHKKQVLTDAQKTAIRCAESDLLGSLQTHKLNQPNYHNWKAHAQSIRDLRAAFADDNVFGPVIHLV